MNTVHSADFAGDKSRLFAIYNSRGLEHIILAKSEASARSLARNGFDFVRTNDFVSKELPKNYLSVKHLIPESDRLRSLMKNGSQGRIRVEYAGKPIPEASAYFFAYGTNHEVKL